MRRIGQQRQTAAHESAHDLDAEIPQLDAARDTQHLPR